MKFQEQLQQYIQACGCSGKELADASGLSASLISRYRNGERVPRQDQPQLLQLAHGLAVLMPQKEELEILNDLTKSLSLPSDQPEIHIRHLNQLITDLHINVSEMAHYLNYDASFLSRIRSEQRKIVHPEAFLTKLSGYLWRRFGQELPAVARVIGCEAEQIQEETSFFAAVRHFLTEKETGQQPMDRFLRKVDAFDLQNYLHAVHYEDLKVPHVVWMRMKAKGYYGLEEMKNGELDFLKQTVLSKSMEPVFFCSDMPMQDMAEDAAFAKKYVFGLAMLLKKGLHLNVVHTINRPFHEMLLGLENWIPMYMTGQIAPYYLKHTGNSFYGHFLNVSGSAALWGECLVSDHANGRYFLETRSSELGYYRRRAEAILKHASPLMQIYREDAMQEFHAALGQAYQQSQTWYGLLSAPPLFTISKELLHRILQRNQVPDAQQQQILAYAAAKRQQLLEKLQHAVITIQLPQLEAGSGSAKSMLLSLSELFYERPVCYTEEEYQMHLAETMQFAAAHPNFQVHMQNQSVFQNIQIQFTGTNWAMVSKHAAPAIHFIIRQPKLCLAIREMFLPLWEHAEQEIEQPFEKQN